MKLKQEILDRFNLSAEYVANAAPFQPKVAIVAGSGVLQSLRNYRQIEIIPYKEIPNFPTTTVSGHAGELIYSEILNTKAIIFSGRFHLYEGKSMLEANSLIILSSLLGINNIILTNAAGGLDPSYTPGEIMINRDFFNLTFRSVFELFEPNMLYRTKSDIINQSWLERIKTKLNDLGSPFNIGTYAGVTGPNYETRAEIRMLRTMGANAVGMSTVLEAQTASLLGLNVSSCSIITNSAKEVFTPQVTHDEVLMTANLFKSRMMNYIISACETIG